MMMMMVMKMHSQHQEGLISLPCIYQFQRPHWPIRKLAVVGQRARYTPLKKCNQADEAWSFRQCGSVFQQTMNRDDFQVVSPISSIAMSKACTSDSGK